MAAAMKHMASNFAKLVDDGGENPTVEQNVKTSKELWDTLEAKYMAEDASILEQYNELLGILGRFTQHKMNMDESIQEELTLIDLGSDLRIEESLRAQDNDKPKGNNVVGPSVVNMVEHNNSSRYNDNKGKRKHHNTRANPNKKPKVACWRYEKPGHLKKDCKAGNVGNRANGSGTKGSEDGSSNPLKGQSMFNKSLQIYYITYVSEAYFVQDDDVAWWVDSGATVHVCKDRCWFNLLESLKMVHFFTWEMSQQPLSYGTAFMSTFKLNDSILWHARLGHIHFKRMQDMSKDGLIPAFDMDIEKCQTCILNKITKKPFQNIKRETKVLELIHIDLCNLHATPSLGNKKYFVTFIDDASRFCYVYLLHSKDEALDKFKVFKTEVELQQGSLIKRFRTDRGGEYMDTLAVVRLPDPKLKTLGERGIECIFFGYAKHSKAFRFYVIEPNDSVAINFIIESRDAIFDEHRFPSVPRPSQRSLVKGTEGSGGSVVSERVTDEIDDPKTFDEAIKSQDFAFWKEAINDEMDFIMGNNTWVLTDLPPGCRPLAANESSKES
ncbi:zinc finger, CCHC-type containing protein [Tanacetum coccineum]